MPISQTQHLISPLQFWYFHKIPGSRISAFALKSFGRVSVSEEMLLGLAKTYCALVLFSDSYYFEVN